MSTHRPSSSSSPASSALFARLIDDAAMFPPGNAAAADAISGHLHHRSSGLDPYVGPLLVHHHRWDEVARAHAELGSPRLHVVVVGSHRLPGPDAPGMKVVGFETPVDAEPLPEAEGGLPLACEVSVGDGGRAVLAAVATAAAAGARVVAKIRTGGTSADAFPDEQTVAAALQAAVALAAPMKFTAGLHHAVRFTAAGTGFEHHGFLNLLVAAARAHEGADVGALGGTLANRDAAHLADALRALSAEQVGQVRRTCVSFGCCGVEEPVADLVALGLIPPVEADASAGVRR